jgi:alpha-galactosidase
MRIFNSLSLSLFLMCFPQVLSLSGSLARKKPQLGWNSWNCYGGSVTSKDLRDTADFLVSSGLSSIYSFVISDDGWTSGRDSITNEIIPDPIKFPDVANGSLASYIHSKGLKLGIYSAASSVVCSGRVGSLYHEVIDAVTFGRWGVDYVKYDK